MCFLGIDSIYSKLYFEKDTLSCSRCLLINLHRVDQPIRISEIRRVSCNIILASRGLRRARTATPYTPRPAATKSCVKNDIVVGKRVFKIATTITTSETSQWSSPRLHIWGSAVDVTGNVASLPEPDIDPIRRPLHSIDTTAHGIEARAIVIRVRSAHSAAGVAVVLVAVCREGIGTAERVGVGDGTAGRCVQCDRVSRLGVYSLDDVDFAACGPVWSEHPECWPCSADSSGHVLDVCNE